MAKKKPETKDAPAPKPAAAIPAPAAKPTAPAVAATPSASAHAGHAAAPAVHAAQAAPAVDAGSERHGFRRKLLGRVTSSKMNKTVVVEVIRSSVDPVYKKYVRSRARYKAHDETNQYKVGDRVEIQEHRPISRDKRWLVTKLIARTVEE